VNLIRWFSNPNIPPTVNKRNFLNVQIDAVGIGLASAAAPFLPVFLTRLGASNLQVSMLTSMPALTGLILAIPIGRFLQSRRKIVPWFSAARLLVVLSYAFTGLVSFFIPQQQATIAILVIWALATLPQTVVAIAFSVVMNAVAGPASRYELMTRRWSILGLTTSITVVIAGQILDRLGFPINYQLVFMGLSLGGLISYYFSSHIDLPDSVPPRHEDGLSLAKRVRGYAKLVLSERPFVSFTLKRLVFLTGTALAAPIFPLYYVRVVNASDAWIGIISTAQSAILILGYFFWSRQSKLHGSRPVLLWTTLGVSLYPALTAFTHQAWLIAVFAGLSGIFQAGLDLVFFDELMKSVPVEYSATFVSIAQSLQYLSAVAAPTIGSLLANQIGLGGALLVSAGIRMVGFLLFAFGNRLQAVQKAPLPLR
jgi:hypothetical protein